MTIYNKGSKQHLKVWKQNFGPIPRDKEGRSYEIHHIDGNHSNNHISNLKLVTIQEHYNIHYSQGDLSACLIMSKRMMISPHEKSELARKANAKRIENGTFHFLKRPDGTSLGKDVQNERVKNGTHHLLGGKIQHDRVENGTHHLLGGDIQSKTQLKLLKEGKHISQQMMNCCHCGKTFNKGNFLRWHGNNCKLK
jgi:hypothetical protein